MQTPSKHNNVPRSRASFPILQWISLYRKIERDPRERLTMKRDKDVDTKKNGKSSKKRKAISACIKKN